jgi:methionine sulfoxide reductase heme-binding subunit
LIRVAKTIVFLLCLVPFFLLLWGIFVTNDLGANPVETITHTTGDWILRFLVLTLCVTPLRQLTGWTWVTRFRRMLGLFAFFYTLPHLTIYVLSLKAFDWKEIAIDIAKRPYITVGFLGFVLMIPLAITSTKKWIVRLGGKRWRMLHRLIYVSAIAGVLHYLWLVKLDITSPTRYAIAVGLLLLFRIWTAVRSRQPVTQLSGEVR